MTTTKDHSLLPQSMADELKQFCLDIRKLIDYDNNWNSKVALSSSTSGGMILYKKQVKNNI